MIAPEIERMAAQYSKVAFAKLNCGLDNDSKRLVSCWLAVCACSGQSNIGVGMVVWVFYVRLLMLSSIT